MGKGFPRRVLVCGDRNWNDRAYLYDRLDQLSAWQAFTTVIDGTAPGADCMAHDWADLHGIQSVRYPALWSEYGRAAGPIRNRQMLTEGKPDLVVAFHQDINQSKGTRDMIRQASRAGVDVVLFDGTDAQGLYNPDV